MLCTYCDKEFKNKYNLKAHQLRPSCLKNKVKDVEFVYYQCSLCEKELSNKYKLKKHEIVCSLRKKENVKTVDIVTDENIILKNKIEKLTCENSDQSQQIKELTCENSDKSQQIKELKDLVYRLTDKSIININNTNNDNRKINININIKNYIKESPECMSIENLQKYITRLNIGHVLSEGNGYGNFINQYVIQHIRMITTDASRGIVFYKDENGKVYKDIGLSSFFKKFGIVSAPHVKHLVETFLNTLNLDLSEPNNIEQYRDYNKHITRMNQCSKGDKSEFIPSALKVITSGTDHSNIIC